MHKNTHTYKYTQIHMHVNSLTTIFTCRQIHTHINEHIHLTEFCYLCTYKLLFLGYGMCNAMGNVFGCLGIFVFLYAQQPQRLASTYSFPCDLPSDLLPSGIISVN